MFKDDHCKKCADICRNCANECKKTECKGFSERLCAFGSLIPFHASLAAQKQLYRFRKAQVKELLYKIDGSTTLLAAVPKPLASADGYTVMAFPAPFPASTGKLLPLPLEKIHQVNRVGALLLFFVKMNMGHLSIPPSLASVFPATAKKATR
jgi:Domain of Unknown Function (DUF326).